MNLAIALIGHTIIIVMYDSLNVKLMAGHVIDCL